MTGLVLKLQPNEKFLVNGVVMQNGDRTARIRIRTSDVSILRMRDALCPDEANTPLKRVYYLAQLALIGDVSPVDAKQEILNQLTELKSIFAGEASVTIDKALAGVEAAKFFVVMRAVRKLFPLESAMLKRSL